MPAPEYRNTQASEVRTVLRAGKKTGGCSIASYDLCEVVDASRRDVVLVPGLEQKQQDGLAGLAAICRGHVCALPVECKVSRIRSEPM